MKKQQTFTDAEYAQRKLISGREKFPDTMDAIVPRAVFGEKIAPFYPKSGRRGRPPKGIELMLRMYFPWGWYKLSGEGIEGNIYDSYAMRKFMRPGYFKEDMSDATTLPQFRHPHEKHNLQEELFRTQQKLMDEAGLITRGGTIADATIIAAPGFDEEQREKPGSGDETG